MPDLSTGNGQLVAAMYGGLAYDPSLERTGGYSLGMFLVYSISLGGM